MISVVPEMASASHLGALLLIAGQAGEEAVGGDAVFPGLPWDQGHEQSAGGGQEDEDGEDREAVVHRLALLSDSPARPQWKSHGHWKITTAPKAMMPPAKSMAPAVCSWPFWRNLATQPMPKVPAPAALTTPSTT